MFKFSSQLLRITLFSLLCLFILISYVVDSPAQWKTGGWGDVVLKAMQIYLILLFLRTLFYVGFSFLEFLNRTDLRLSDRYPLVTIIIPGYNEELVIQKAIESTAKVQYPNLEILVIDDGSTDQMFLKAIEAAKKFHNVRVISKPNGGKADALNWGIREAYGEFVLCMDADSKLKPNVLLVSVPYLESDPNVAAVAGNVMIGNSRTNLLTRFQQLEYIIGLNFYKAAQSYLGIVNIVPGPVGLFRKSALLDVGGYEVDTFAEDCDLTVRLLTKGYVVKYCPEMKAVTEAPEQIMELVTQRYRWNRGITQAIIKNAACLFSPQSNFRNRVLILQMLGDSILIPLINYIFAMGTIFFVLLFGDHSTSIFGPFFLGLVCLDIILTFFSSYTEGQVGKMALLTILNRMTYGLSLEILRFYSMLDEILGVPMKWGILKRKGLR
jgi:cellulose synthase/poly-beta-1,6-N-acetylglucosamine synthase-like glycosyltransferase